MADFVYQRSAWMKIGIPSHFNRALTLGILLFTLTACSTVRHSHPPSRGADAAPHYKVGKPYKVKGRWYHPKEDTDYEAVGVASWYGRKFHGRPTANGELFDMNRLSAAHRTLPLPSLVEVTNLKNGRRIVVRVNDRGPFANNRLIDLSRAAARRLGFEQRGLARVRVRYVGRAQLTAKAPKSSARVAQTAPAPPAPKVRQTLEQPAPDHPHEMKDQPNPKMLVAMVTTPDSAASHSISPSTDGPDDMAIESPPLPTSRRVTAAPTSLITAAPSGDAPHEGHNEAADDQSTAELYVIRVAALSSLDNIEALKEQLEKIGPLLLSRIESDVGSVFYRVNMGPFSSVEIANKQLEAVRGAGYSDAGLITITP
jgi:peptidoglycan lytic transglycosylase